MKRTKLFVTCILLAVTAVVNAQNLQVKGTVVDAEGQPIPGVSVIIEGTTIGTATNADGQYSINAKPGAALQFSFFGMKNHVVKIGNSSEINVTMEVDAVGLDEAVITATGMTRQEKTLGYASTTVRSDEINKGHAADALSGLAGKVAGMQISSTGGTGTSQKVIIRGYSSLTGSNQPLYVVDGVPMSNSISGVQDLNNAVDFGNGATDVNPENIESITVLKGASATALYGSRAANGVIIITTKSAKQNETVKVAYDGAFMASNVLRIPQTQKTFGQGWYYDGQYGKFNPDEGTFAYHNAFGNYAVAENGSWGNRLDGRQVEWRPGAHYFEGADPSYTSYSYKDGSLKNFYTTGFETTNTVTVQGGSETTGLTASYSNTYSNGVLPGNSDTWKRNIFSFRGNTKIKGGLAWLNYGINYVNKSSRSAMSGQGGSGSTIYQDILQYPINIDYADLRDYKSVYNNADNFYTPFAQNPWWTLDHNYATYEQDRIYGNIEFGVQLIPGLQFIARGGGDFANSLEKDYNDLWKFNSSTYTETEGGSPEIGSYSEYSSRSSQIDGNFFFNADYKFGAAKDWSIHGVLGFNVNQRSSSYLQGAFQGLAMENYRSFDNTTGATPTASSYESLRRLAGLYAQADLGWRDAVYLTLSARNDWSSTLPKNNNSFFYWGVNGSVILTDLIPSMKNDVLSFLKLRGGYGKTGNDAGPYYTSSYFASTSASGGFGALVFPLDGFNGFALSSRIPATSLKPEISTEVEAGIDIRFFNNRLGIDAAYYNKKTENQIMSVTLAPEAGFTSAIKNVGCIRNQGIELAVTGVPVKTRNFEWRIGYTFSKNYSKVESLWDGVDEYNIYGLSSGPQLIAKVGEPLGVWTDYKISKVEDKNSPYYGCTIVDPVTGYPQYSTSETEVIGKADPDFTMGLNNNFRYKWFSLGFSFDWRQGGMFYSATKGIVMFNGNDESTAYNYRDAWVEPNSVINVGTASEPVYVENTTPVDNAYNMNGVHYSNYNYAKYREEMLDKSYLKLRELNFTFSMPRKWFAGVKWLTGIDVSFVGRNLLMWTPKQGIVDPDMSNYGNDLESQYGEYYGAPSTRTLGGSIKVIF